MLSTSRLGEYGAVHVSEYVGPPNLTVVVALTGKSGLTPKFVIVSGSAWYCNASLFRFDTCHVNWSEVENCSAPWVATLPPEPRTTGSSRLMYSCVRRYHSLSLTIGPDTWSDGWYLKKSGSSFRDRPVAPVPSSAWELKIIPNTPSKSFDPCFWVICAKPPCARPYSTPAPAVTTEISSIESEATWLRNRPVRGSTLLTPDTVALKSRSRAPLTLGLPSPSGS